jgi:hypothetical protein
MIETLNSIREFMLGGGIYDLFVSLYSWVIIKITIWNFTALMYSLQFSFDIAKEIMQQLNITNEMNNLLATLPPDTYQQLQFFNVIEGINLLLNAAATRFVMSFRG